MKHPGVKIGILGFGEVGKAISQFYDKPKIKDLTRDDGLAGVDILHVCIPYNKSFSTFVAKQIDLIQPKLTIIHSTVTPGTTKLLAKKFAGMVVHSPIRGIHPQLFKGIQTFVKYIGADNKKAGKLAETHFKKLKLKTKVFSSSASTELGKLLDTTYYGVCIAWHGEMKKLANKWNVNFDDAITDFNTSYNEGYTKLGKKNVVRPVLYPPKGPIGGHCVVPNAKILKQFIKSKAIDLILEYGE